MANPFRRAAARALAPARPGGPRASGRTAFAAAAFSRLTADWIFAFSRSADAELRGELRALRNRAREQLRNSPFAARYAQLLAENVIGPNGIRLQAKNLTQGGDLHTRANQAIEDAWEDAGRAEHWDVQHRLTRTESLALGVGNWGTDGEILIRLYRGPRFGKYGFQAQVLDPDFLADEKNQDAAPGVPLIRQGVEYDDWGAPTYYHLWTRHPADSAFDRVCTRVPASDVIHAFIPLRPGQSRGIPHGVAVMQTLKMLDGYIEAELVAARTASAKMGALVDADPANPSVSATGVTGLASGGRVGSGAANAVPLEADPGSLMDLRGQGVKLDLWDPQHPTAAFPEFTRALTHYLAVGYGTAYGTLTGDLRDANYSSMKVGQQPERDHWRRLQRFVIDHVLDRLFREWLAMALLNQRIPGLPAASAFDANRWTRVAWRARGWPSPDPLKDRQADFMAVAAGVKTLTKIAAEDGEDLEELIAERQQEIALFAAAGVPSVLPIAVPKGASNTLDDAGEGDTGNGSDGGSSSGDESDASDAANASDGDRARAARLVRVG